MMFSHSEFVQLSNRSEYAFCHELGVPPGVTRCVFENLGREALATELVGKNWNAAGAAARRNQFQRALAAWAKANPQNGGVDMSQLRAVEHLSFLDRLLWRSYEILMCKRTYFGANGDKSWDCFVHGMNRGDFKPCQQAYEGWIAGNNY